MNRLAGAGIAPLACRTRLGRKDAETGDGDFIARFKARNDTVNDTLNRAFGISLCGAKHSVNFIYDICLVHENLLIANPHDREGWDAQKYKKRAVLRNGS